jgi:hypothetical protein
VRRGGDHTYGIDTDRAQTPEAPWTALRRRLGGRYPVDPHGFDPQLQDLSAPLLGLGVRVHVEHGELLAASGPALLVCNRGLGLAEPLALTVAVRSECRRRLRVVGVPDWPVVGDALHKLGGIGAYHQDLAALLRAGHLAAVPLGPTWLPRGVGTPPLGLLVAALGYPVQPVAVLPGGPFGLPLRRWRVIVGPPLDIDPVAGQYVVGDPLGAAELAEAARDGIRRLLELPAA